MALEVQEPTFSIKGGGAGSCNNDELYITMISASALTNRIASYRLKLSSDRTRLTQESITESLIKTLLRRMMDIPQTFFNGPDCDMVQNLSRMFRDSMAHHGGVDIDNYLCVFIVVSKVSCHYNVVNSSCFFHEGEQVPSSEYIMSLACESGVYSLPAGARAIMRFKAQDYKEENCAICLQGFPYDSDVAMLPCSHAYHCRCALKWFVHKSTCPLCRFPCTEA